MSDDTVELVERMFRTQRDPAQFFACFDSDVVLYNTAVSPETSPFVGIDGLREWAQMNAEAITDLRFEPQEIIAVGDNRAVCVLRIVGSGRSTGFPIDQGLSTLMTAKQGKITEILSFETKEEALAAVKRG